MNTRLNVINIDPELMSGTPVFRGTRVPVQFLFDHLALGSLEEFLDSYDSVSREQALEVIRIASQAILSEKSTVKKTKNRQHEAVA